ncbi:hypothetical protein GGR50DRAFT_696022 [Xylaria sp. CBS 124048]|nr:hypothetical protein GGR50DRAFT_696022 [Xylaria sp. CBS 124048]
MIIHSRHLLDALATVVDYHPSHPSLTLPRADRRQSPTDVAADHVRFGEVIWELYRNGPSHKAYDERLAGAPGQLNEPDSDLGDYRTGKVRRGLHVLHPRYAVLRPAPRYRARSHMEERVPGSTASTVDTGDRVHVDGSAWACVTDSVEVQSLCVSGCEIRNVLQMAAALPSGDRGPRVGVYYTRGATVVKKKHLESVVRMSCDVKDFFMWRRGLQQREDAAETHAGS